MSSTTTRLRRRLVAVAASGALAAGVLAAAAPAAQAAPATTTGSGPTAVTDATLTWGYSGYAQQGIFGPWTFKDATGDTSILAAGTQQEYRVEPQPTTSQPAARGSFPTAVKFTAGKGTADDRTGQSTLDWTGSFTINAYPAGLNAPDEVYANPQLRVAANGSGSLSFDVTIGAGVGLDGQPSPATSVGRKKVADFAAGSISGDATSGFRLAAAYQGVEYTPPAGEGEQTRSCTGDDRWGAWPAELVNAVPASVRPHYYSTSCGGLQNAKPALPFDLDFTAAPDPEVTVAQTTFDAEGAQVVTVEGRNFDPGLAIGTRPPFSGRQSGAYIAFGRYADSWRPSQPGSGGRNNPSGANGNGVAVKWAVPRASFPGGPPAQDPTSPSYTELRPDGSFTTQITVDRSFLASAVGNFGIYTYTGGGPNVAAYETYTPIRFVTDSATDVTGLPATATYGDDLVAEVDVTGSGGTPTGSVEVLDGDDPIAEGDLVDGSASIDLPSDLAVGEHELTFAYGGDATFDVSSDSHVLTIEKGASTTTIAAPATPYGKAGRATVTVASPGGTPTGAVTLTGDGRERTADLVGGVATFELSGKLARRMHALQVSYAGSSSLEASAGTVSYVVGKGSVAISRSGTTKPTTKKTGSTSVTVSHTGAVAPTGKVRIVLTRAGTTLNGPMATLKKGKAKLTIPKVTRTGSWAALVRYYGDDNHLLREGSKGTLSIK